LRPRVVDGVAQSSPVGLEHLPVLMDRTTVEPPATKEIPGLINVNTAPGVVLRCIEGLTDEQIRAIMEIRGSLTGEQRATTAWLVVEDVLDLDTYIAIAPKITARGQQFTVESLGYGDHVGTVTRLQAVVDLVGPIAQTVYCRDITSIGGRFPVRKGDEEFVRER
ncbi:MAG: general secretion pathway protein GspK, partial [Planctomycetes bacterium]|nr:general secretion pathway protein GspK [Planctomycetota bacterium]